MKYEHKNSLLLIIMTGFWLNGCTNSIQFSSKMPQICSSCPSTVPSTNEAIKQDTTIQEHHPEMCVIEEQQDDSLDSSQSITNRKNSGNSKSQNRSSSEYSGTQNNAQTDQERIKESVNKIKSLARGASEIAQSASEQNGLAKTNASKAATSIQQAVHAALKGDRESTFKHVHNTIQASQAANQASTNANRLAREAWRKADEADRINQSFQNASKKGLDEASVSSANLAANQTMRSAQHAQTESEQAGKWATNANKIALQSEELEGIARTMSAVKSLAGKTQKDLKNLAKKTRHFDKNSESGTVNQEKGSSHTKTSLEQNKAMQQGIGNPYGRIDPKEIPELPALPNMRPLPEGVIAPNPQPEKKKEIILGIWKQTGGSNQSDFLPGGYRQCTWTFHADGILEVCRIFGEKQEVSLTWKIGYDWDGTKAKLSLGKDPKFRPSQDSLAGFTVEKLNLSVKPAAQSLPVMLHLRFLADNQIQVDEKEYREMK
jgi:hypothetical protein